MTRGGVGTVVWRGGLAQRGSAAGGCWCGEGGGAWGGGTGEGWRSLGADGTRRVPRSESESESERDRQ